MALVLLPRALSDFRAQQLAFVAIYFVALLGLNVLIGFSGQVSLGHGAFMALGGYTTAILIAEFGVRDLWTIPVGGLVAGAAGLAFGLPATRLTGAYLALATFGIAVALPAVIKKAEGWSGGSTGLNLFGLEQLSGLGVEVTFLGRTLTYNDWLYYLCWTVAAVMFAVAWFAVRGRLGRAFKAIRDSEVAAASSGIGPTAYKTIAFGISAFYAGIAGSLYALAVTYVNPEVFPVTLSIFLLVGVVVGGLGTLWTTAFGALFIQFLPDVAQRLSKAPGSPAIVYAVVLIALMLALPGGIAGLLRLTNRLYHRPSS